MQYGTVSGRFLAAVADTNADTDRNPDEVPLVGKVTFTAELPKGRALQVIGQKATILPVPIVCTLDSAGYLTQNGARTVNLIATDTDETNPRDFTYKVTFTGLTYAGTPVSYGPFSIAVPAGQTIDLSAVAPVSASNGAPIIRGPLGAKGDRGDVGPRGLVGPQGDQGVPGDPTPYMKVLDGDGPSWQVQFDDGTPPFVTATEQDGITSKVKQLAGLAAAGVRLEELTADSGYSFGVVYEHPVTKVWNLQYGIRDDGSIYQPSAGGTSLPMLPGPDIVCVGDSITAGAGGGGTTYPAVLQSLLTTSGRPGTVRNLGVGGEQSCDMAARYAGGTMLAFPVGGVWPDQGSVDVVITNDDKTGTTSFIVQGNPGLNPCVFAGVPGTWTLVWNAAASKYVATRTTAGAAATVTRPAAIIPAAAKDRASDILIVWAGRNNAMQTPRVLSDIATMLDHQRAGSPLWLVVGILNGAGEGTGTGVYNAITAGAATQKQLYGRRFIDARRYLVDYGLQDAKITPTAQDTADIAADIVPTSLRSDAIHPNAAAYQLLGRLMFDRLVEIGTN